MLLHFPPLVFGLGCTRHSGVTYAVVVGFSRTGDGHNHRQGAAFARAEVDLPEASRELARPGLRFWAVHVRTLGVGRSMANRGRCSQVAVVIRIPEVPSSMLTQPSLARPGDPKERVGHGVQPLSLIPAASCWGSVHFSV